MRKMELKNIFSDAFFIFFTFFTFLKCIFPHYAFSTCSFSHFFHIFTFFSNDKKCEKMHLKTQLGKLHSEFVYPILIFLVRDFLIGEEQFISIGSGLCRSQSGKSTSSAAKGGGGSFRIGNL